MKGEVISLSVETPLKIGVSTVEREIITHKPTGRRLVRGD